jgi:hypothetical protein
VLLPLLVVAQVGWALLYGAVAEPRLRGSAGVRGLQFAVLPWLASGLLVLPLLGAGLFGLDLGVGWVPAVGEAVRCAFFGAALGVLYRLARLARQPRGHDGRRHGHRNRATLPAPGAMLPAPALNGAALNGAALNGAALNGAARSARNGAAVSQERSGPPGR